MIPSEILTSSFLEAGIGCFGIVGEDRFREACSAMPTALRERLGLGGAAGAIAVALAYGEGPEAAQLSAAMPSFRDCPGPKARLARFARADWYGELAARLKDAAARIRARLREEGRDPWPAREWRYFVNSGLPEKRLALEAGLGRLGRHGLVMLPGHGSAAVLGVLVLPPDAATAAEPVAAGDARRLSPSCGQCAKCVAACPTGALAPDGGFARELCLQHWSSIPGALPAPVEAAWGDRLYGCDACQEACPLFSPDAAASTLRGRLGPGLPAAWLVSAPESEIRSTLRGTVLGMRWIAIDALRRNAGMALR